MRSLLNRVIDYLQEKLPPNRIVVLLTPIAFVPGAAWLSAWLGENLPGVSFTPGVITGFAAAGALSALAAAYKWIDGWQQHEKSIQNLVLQDREHHARR